MTSEYLSRRELAAAKVKYSTLREAEAGMALQRLIEGELDSRWYVDLRRTRSDDKTSDPHAVRA
jgi:hypothetical protein